MALGLIGRDESLFSAGALRRLIQRHLEFADQCDLIVIRPPCPQRVSPLDFGHSDELIEGAFKTATEWLDKDEGRRSDPAKWIAPHKHG